MANTQGLIDVSSFYEDRYDSTLPKEIRDKLDIISPEQNLVFVQESNGEISLAHTEKYVEGIIVATANLSGSIYRFTLPKKVREKLKIKKGGKLAYWEQSDKKIILRNARKI